MLKRVPPFFAAFLFVTNFVVLSLLTSQAAEGQQSLRVPSFFNSHMVIQRDKPFAIWGWADKQASVSVEFQNSTATATAGDDGYWKVELPAFPAIATGSEIKIKSGDQKISIADVLVGEVWFASGQSNMAWTLNNTKNASAEIETANHPGFRMFLGENTPADKPQTDIKGSWKVCTAQNSPSFSATAYYFAKNIHLETGVPVGIIKSVWGGKRCECYCSQEKMMSNANGKQMMEQLAQQEAAYDTEKIKARFDKALAAWEAKTADLRKANNKLPKAKRKKVPRKPQLQVRPMMNPSNPTVLYNGMIHPFVGYNMRGAIWYQGESNCRNNLAPIYKEMFTLMIQDWRDRWNDEFPFYFVQLANFRKPTTEPGIDNEWPTVQNQQRLTLQFPKTGMAVINDIGAESDIHPKNKKDVGERLARWALKNEYGKDVVVSGPLYKAMSVSGNKVLIEFDHVAGGLKSSDGGELKRFEIAGEDKKWRWGTATIEGNSISVTSPDVASPVAVRYAWASNPTGANLVNSEGLPASLFRTDDWKASFEK